MIFKITFGRRYFNYLESLFHSKSNVATGKRVHNLRVREKFCLSRKRTQDGCVCWPLRLSLVLTTPAVLALLPGATSPADPAV